MTTDQLPAPPVPKDLDLRDCQWMPLDVVRLRDSELAAVPDPEVFRAAVLSWCVSWHQVPAASLPADDASLARLLGYGRDLKTWRKIKDRGGLRGWVLHNDGRLYHEVVAEKARETKGQKERAAKKREADRKRKDDWRRRSEGEDTGGDDDGRDADQDAEVTPPVTADVTRDNDPCHTVNQTRPDQTRPDRIYTSPPSPASPAPDPAAAAAGLRQIVKGYDPKRLLVAIQAGDLLAVVAAFGGNIERGDEWKRDAVGQRVVAIAAVFDWRMVNGKPIREPSGLRQAISEWTATPSPWRKTYLQEFAADIGLPVLSTGAETITKPPPEAA